MSIRYLRVGLLLGLLVAIGAPGPAAAEDAEALTQALTRGEREEADAARERAFGDALLAEGDAYRAITAYKRARFLAPTLEADLLDYRIALAYFSGEQFEAALRASRAVEGRPALERAARHLGAAALFEAKAYDAVPSLLEGDTGAWARYQIGFSHLMAWRPDEARGAFAAVPEASALFAPARGLVEALTPPVRLPHRSPALAGLLSLIPGLGHLYIGDAGVATSALLWNGAFGWGIYQTIRASLWGLVALVAILESVWYFGTIYGAIAGAQRFNRDARLGWAEELQARFGPPPPPGQPDLPGAPPLSISLPLP